MCPVGEHPPRADGVEFLDIGGETRATAGRLIHHKVSSRFQSEDGARAFATIRSDFATARKHEIGAFGVLVQLFHGDAWVPPPRTT